MKSKHAVTGEMEGATLGDVRLNRRLVQVADRVAGRPAESFPNAFESEAELEGAYRFFVNPRVTPEAILAPHFLRTVERAILAGTVLVAHDTTEFEFGGDVVRKGLGRLLRPGQGFFGHFSLVTSADGQREPLGTLGLETIFRHDPPTPRRKRTKHTSRGESRRWGRQVEKTESLLAGRARAIHLMDREGDSYALLAELTANQRLFVIRSNHNRVLAGTGDTGKLRDAARNAEVLLEREVPLSFRRQIEGPKGKRHPPRTARTARLSIAATEILLPRIGGAGNSEARELPLNLVHVIERSPPAGQIPVEWILLTNLPILRPDDVSFIVDCYRGRWMIEEYFKALKTGCLFEKRQLESAHSLLNALAVLVPVAWRLLRLRHLARSAPTRPASETLTSCQLEVLRAVSKKPLPVRPTTRDALLAVARLGGHIKNNGDPGWQILGRGFHDLLLLELGWRARSRPRCDQS